MEKSASEKNNLENKNEIKDQKYFNEQAKHLMKISFKNPDYKNSIEKEPDNLFLSIDKNTLSNWESLLINKSNITRIPTDNEINLVTRDTNFQKVIQNDCKRTRIIEQILIDNFEETLEKINTYYCKTKNIYYKQ